MKLIYWRNNMSRLFWLINTIYFKINIIFFLFFFNKFDKARDWPNIRDVRNQIDSFYITSLLQSIFILLQIYYAYSILQTTSSSTRVSAPKERLLSNLVLDRSFHYRSSHCKDLASITLLRRVTRKHGHAYTSGCVAQKSISFFLSSVLIFSLPLPHLASHPRRTVSWTSKKLALVFSSGITCQRRISTITFYRFLRSLPSAFHSENCWYLTGRKALSHGAHIVVYSAKRVSTLSSNWDKISQGCVCES